MRGRPIKIKSGAGVSNQTCEQLGRTARAQRVMSKSQCEREREREREIEIERERER
jgi:hypothetical protein